MPSKSITFGHSEKCYQFPELKTALFSYYQTQSQFSAPTFITTNKGGPPHMPRWETKIISNDKRIDGITSGEFRNGKKCEACASLHACQVLGIIDKK